MTLGKQCASINPLPIARWFGAGQRPLAALPGELDAHAPVAVGMDRVFALSHDQGVHGAPGASHKAKAGAQGSRRRAAGAALKRLR